MSRCKLQTSAVPFRLLFWGCLIKLLWSGVFRWSQRTKVDGLRKVDGCRLRSCDAQA